MKSYIVCRSEMGCARTNAVYRRRPSSRTHVQGWLTELDDSAACGF